jgi:hypothetical protein
MSGNKKRHSQLDARGGSLELFLDSGLKGRIVDFDVRGFTLQKGAEPPRIVSERMIISRKRDRVVPDKDAEVVAGEFQ